jgi:biopolymer transport protein ExbD
MKRIDSINVIPFIDIMLVLLAIVLTTATFIARGVIPVELPESKAELGSLSDVALIVSITSDGELYIDGEHGVIEDLEALSSEFENETPVVLGVDSSAPFGVFFDVVDRLKQRGFENLSIEARPASR